MRSMLLFMILCLGIIVAQTTVLRPPFFPAVFYDFFIPVVVFARLNLPSRKAFLFAVVTGFVMDLFSGGLFGVYISIYVWIFFVVKGGSSYFNAQGTRFRMLLIALSVLAENLIICLFAVFPGNFWEGLWEHLDMVVWQVLLAGATGPVIVWGLEKGQRRLFEAQQDKKNKTVSLWMTDI